MDGAIDQTRMARLMKLESDQADTMMWLFDTSTWLHRALQFCKFLSMKEFHFAFFKDRAKREPKCGTCDGKEKVNLSIPLPSNA